MNDTEGGPAMGRISSSSLASSTTPGVWKLRRQQQMEARRRAVKSLKSSASEEASADRDIDGTEELARFSSVISAPEQFPFGQDVAGMHLSSSSTQRCSALSASSVETSEPRAAQDAHPLPTVDEIMSIDAIPSSFPTDIGLMEGLDDDNGMRQGLDDYKSIPVHWTDSGYTTGSSVANEAETTCSTEKSVSVATESDTWALSTETERATRGSDSAKTSHSEARSITMSLDIGFIRQVFVQFAREDSGVILLHDLASALSSLGLALKASELHDLVIEADPAGKDELDFGEFAALAASAAALPVAPTVVSSSDARKGAGSSETRVRDLEAVFRQHVFADDSTVAVEDLPAMMSFLGPTPTEVDTLPILSAVGVERNGRFGLREFVTIGMQLDAIACRADQAHDSTIGPTNPPASSLPRRVSFKRQSQPSRCEQSPWSGPDAAPN